MPRSHRNAREGVEAVATLPVPTAPCHNRPFRLPRRARAEEHPCCCRDGRNGHREGSVSQRTFLKLRMPGDSGERPALLFPKNAEVCGLLERKLFRVSAYQFHDLSRCYVQRTFSFTAI
ncbi:hypothetical protein NDU88_002184 [Pleurodeles waltl]|uniref:Uncharacterized protein n=1 Tax=Pleurodeles waltl TaxID=8319 RepID=A0AAV7MA85_PLEWA|nr:hypothetical protein NDU88_002184 [Pleurodeles waltl]